MTVKLLTEQHLDSLPLKGDYTGSSESTLVKMPHCCKSHIMAHIMMTKNRGFITQGDKEHTSSVKFGTARALETNIRHQSAGERFMSFR